MMKILVRVVCSVLAVGSMALVVTLPNTPSLSLGAEAFAGVPECKSRCRDKQGTCISKCSNNDCFQGCYSAERECEKDCEASGK